MTSITSCVAASALTAQVTSSASQREQFNSCSSAWPKATMRSCSTGSNEATYQTSVGKDKPQRQRKNMKKNIHSISVEHRIIWTLSNHHRGGIRCTICMNQNLQLMRPGLGSLGFKICKAWLSAKNPKTPKCHQTAVDHVDTTLCCDICIFAAQGTWWL